jgi:hypothetical protein
LKRNKNNDALAFWLQARRFSDAAQNSSLESSPLNLYYSFLNATKALLSVKRTQHDDHHGVSGDRPLNAKAYLKNEMVKFKSSGVLPGLCSYLGDTAKGEEYSLKELFWNLPFVHRAFRHTFTSSPELFIPLDQACYVSHKKNNEAWFQAEVTSRYCDNRTLRHIPSSFEFFKVDDKTYIRRSKRFTWLQGRSTKQQKTNALLRLSNYHSSTRRVIVTISGNHDFWYLKKTLKENRLTGRHGLTIIFACMHRLSELSRYDPRGFERHLCGEANWLITEFIEHSTYQFIDQIASEITGFQFWRPQIKS